MRKYHADLVLEPLRTYQIPDKIPEFWIEKNSRLGKRVAFLGKHISASHFANPELKRVFEMLFSMFDEEGNFVTGIDSTDSTNVSFDSLVRSFFQDPLQLYQLRDSLAPEEKSIFWVFVGLSLRFSQEAHEIIDLQVLGEFLLEDLGLEDISAFKSEDVATILLKMGLEHRKDDGFGKDIEVFRNFINRSTLSWEEKNLLVAAFGVNFWGRKHMVGVRNMIKQYQIHQMLTGAYDLEVPRLFHEVDDDMVFESIFLDRDYPDDLDRQTFPSYFHYHADIYERHAAKESNSPLIFSGPYQGDSTKPPSIMIRGALENWSYYLKQLLASRPIADQVMKQYSLLLGEIDIPNNLGRSVEPRAGEYNKYSVRALNDLFRRVKEWEKFDLVLRSFLEFPGGKDYFRPMIETLPFDEESRASHSQGGNTLNDMNGLLVRSLVPYMGKRMQDLNHSRILIDSLGQTIRDSAQRLLHGRSFGGRRESEALFVDRVNFDYTQYTSLKGEIRDAAFGRLTDGVVSQFPNLIRVFMESKIQSFDEFVRRDNLIVNFQGVKQGVLLKTEKKLIEALSRDDFEFNDFLEEHTLNNLIHYVEEVKQMSQSTRVSLSKFKGLVDELRKNKGNIPRDLRNLIDDQVLPMIQDLSDFLNYLDQQFEVELRNDLPQFLDTLFSDFDSFLMTRSLLFSEPNSLIDSLSGSNNDTVQLIAA